MTTTNNINTVNYIFHFIHILLANIQLLGLIQSLSGPHTKGWVVVWLLGDIASCAHCT